MYSDLLRHYPDFPKEGIDFVDVLPLLSSKTAFHAVVDRLASLVSSPNLAIVEARGFLFGSPLLYGSDRVQSLIPVRKKGKLPHDEGDLRVVRIEKEYGFDELAYRPSDILHGTPHPELPEFHVTIFDDLLATGGTAYGLGEALRNEQLTLTLGTQPTPYKVVVDKFLFLVELPDLQGRKLLESIAPVEAIIR